MHRLVIGAALAAAITTAVSAARAQAADTGAAESLFQAGKKLLASRGFDPVLGARPLRRTIQREIEDALSEKILYGELTSGQIVVVDVEGEGTDAKFTFRGEAKPVDVPDTPPVAGVLRRHLEARGADTESADLLEALNSEMDDSDRDLRIGPSYLMRDEAQTDEGLEKIWQLDLLPLLDEHYYGRLTRSEVRERFGLEALRRSLKKK